MSPFFLLIFGPILTLTAPVNPVLAEGKTSLSEPDLRSFGHFFFEYEGDVIVRRKPIGKLDAERMGALQKLSLENQLQEYLEKRHQEWWKAAWGRLITVDVLVRFLASFGLGTWEYALHRRTINSTSPQEPQPPNRKWGSKSDSCRRCIASVSDADDGGKKPPKRSRAASFARLGLSSSLGLWILYDLYRAATFAGVDLEWEWVAEKNRSADWKSSLGDQLSSLQTSSLFEALKNHLCESGMDGAYLTKVLAPLSPEDLWKGHALKGFVLIEPNSKTMDPITIELEWLESGEWIYKNSWVGSPTEIVRPNPFDLASLRN